MTADTRPKETLATTNSITERARLSTQGDVARRHAALAVKYWDPSWTEDPDETWMSRSAEILNELGHLIHDAQTDAELLVLVKEWRAHLAASCWDVRDILRTAHRDRLDVEEFDHYASSDAVEVSFR